MLPALQQLDAGVGRGPRPGPGAAGVNTWGASPATTAPDPTSEIVAASIDGREGKEPETIPERFVDAFGRNDPEALVALYDPLHDQFASADGTRIAFRFSMRFHNTAEFFGHPATGRRGVHSEFHSLRVDGGRVTEQVVCDISYGIPYIELTEWKREYPTDTPDPAPRL